MCACAVLPNTKYFSNVTRKGPRSYWILFYCPKPSSSFKRQWLESTITKLPSLLPFPLFLLDVFEHSFVLFRKFLSSKSFRFSSRVRGPSKERGFCDKKDSEEVELVRKASGKNSEKVSKPWQEGLEELPTTCYCVSRVFRFYSQLTHYFTISLMISEFALKELHSYF